MIDAKLQRLMLRSIGVGVLASGVVLIAGEPASTVDPAPSAISSPTNAPP